VSQFLQEMPGCDAASACALLVVILIRTNLLGVHYLITKFVAAGFTFTTYFVLRRQDTFIRPTAF
jgi:hypothetical protein